MDRLGYPRRFAWSTALRGCIGFGGDLVSISNEKEKKFVHNLSFKNRNRTSVWIGLVFGMKRADTYGTMENCLTVLFPSSGSATCQDIFMKMNASKS